MKEQRTKMEYRNLGPTGLKVSALGLSQFKDRNTDDKRMKDIVREAWLAGINWFVTDEYTVTQMNGQLGQALSCLDIPRKNYVIGLNIFYNIKKSEQIANRNGLSRKHIIEGVKNCLKVMNHSYVDVLFAHRHDNITPLEETCRAFDWLIRKGYAYYWGTSEWYGEQIAQAHYICQKYQLIRPTIEQTKYNILVRKKVQVEYRGLLRRERLGVVGYGSEEIQRQLHKYDPCQERQKVDEKKMSALKGVSQRLGCTVGQLSIGWSLRNPDVSCVLIDASSLEQVQETIKGIQVRKCITNQIEKQIEEQFQSYPKGTRTLGEYPLSRRYQHLNI